MQTQSLINPAFIKPRYDAGGFANLPAFITSLLGGPTVDYPFDGLRETYENVLLFLVDGFGWRFFERFTDSPALNRFVRQGRVAKLTSLFPSTTSAHIPFIHSGLPIGESGLHEWNYYEPLLDAMIVPLLFSFSGSAKRDQLKSTGLNPKALYPPHSLYRRLKGLGVKSQVFQSREYTPSTYSNIAFKGATTQGFKTLPELLVNLCASLAATKGKNYLFAYYDKIDTLNHDYGPDSPQSDAEIDSFLTILERHFFAQKPKGGGKTLLLLTADHGQAEVDPQTTVYLNHAFPGMERFMRAAKDGQLLVPGGSCRDMFLYIQEEHLEEVQSTLAAGLNGKADVIRTSQLIEAGYFGAHVTPRLLERMGNLVILPYRFESVWWYQKDKFEQKYFGHHGGLTPQEMEIPLLALEI